MPIRSRGHVHSHQRQRHRPRTQQKDLIDQTISIHNVHGKSIRTTITGLSNYLAVTVPAPPILTFQASKEVAAMSDDRNS
jgi:hypothetical protein